MGWRVVATVIISIFVILTLSVTTAQPLHSATGVVSDLDGGEENNGLDAGSMAESGERAYANLILILSLGLIGWALWWLIRRELTTGRL